MRSSRLTSLLALSSLLAACSDGASMTPPVDSGAPPVDGAVADGPVAPPDALPVDATIAPPDAMPPDATVLPPDATVVPPDGAVAAADATPADAAPADATPADATPAPPNEGIVIISENTGSVTNSAGVTIHNGPLFGTPSAVFGECDQYAMPSDSGLNAGTITIGGTSTPITLTPSGVAPMVTYTYSPDPLPVDMFTDGATITFTAAGGVDVPAFSGSEVAPATITGFTPPSSLSRSSPPTLTWTAGSGEEMWAWIVSFDPVTGSQQILWCRTADDGSFSFPGAGTTSIPSSHTMAIVVLWRTNANLVTTGTFGIALTVSHAHGSNLLSVGP